MNFPEMNLIAEGVSLGEYSLLLGAGASIGSLGPVHIDGSRS